MIYIKSTSLSTAQCCYYLYAHFPPDQSISDRPRPGTEKAFCERPSIIPGKTVEKAPAYRISRCLRAESGHFKDIEQPEFEKFSRGV
jgi:hypothetical protein